MLVSIKLKPKIYHVFRWASPYLQAISEASILSDSQDQELQPELALERLNLT